MTSSLWPTQRDSTTGKHAEIARADNGVRTLSGATMKNPLDTLWGTVIAGLVLTAVLYAIVKTAMGG